MVKTFCPRGWITRICESGWCQGDQKDKFDSFDKF